MNNEDFNQVTRNNKIIRLVNHVEELLNKRYSRSFISNVLSSIDVDRQILMRVVSKEEMERLCVRGSYSRLQDGRFVSIAHTSVSVLYGDVEMGQVNSVVENGYKKYYEHKPTVVHSNTAFILTKQHNYYYDDDLITMSNASTLYLLANGGEQIV